MLGGRAWSRASYCADMTALDAQSLAARVDELMPQVRADLEQLVAIPSINFPGYDQSDVERCAHACAQLLTDAGATPQLIPSTSGVPTVRADVPGPAGSPPSCCTRTTTSSLPATRANGTQHRSSPRNGMGACTAEAPQTTSPVS